MNVKPLGDKVLVKRCEPKEVVRGGIILPDSAKEKPLEAKVIALGTGKTTDEGKVLPFEVKEGDTVLIGKYAGQDIKIDGEEYIMLPEKDILAILG